MLRPLLALRLHAPLRLASTALLLMLMTVLTPMAGAQDILYELTSPNPAEQGYLGRSVAGVPDTDGDGTEDLLVGAPGESIGGRAHLYSGATGDVIYSLQSPNEQSLGNFGQSVSGVPDADGDGWGDILVGAPDEEISGRVYLFSGATGLLLFELRSPELSDNPLARFGYSVSGVPDTDGDGQGDIIISAPGENISDFLGRAYLFSGATGDLLHAFITPNYFSEAGRFGESVVGVADVDGDSRGDLLVGEPLSDPNSRWNAGRAYVYSGATGTLLYELQSPNPERNGFFGDAVAGVPDADGDGWGDLLIGARGESSGLNLDGAGRAYLFSGVTGDLLNEFKSPNEERFGGFSASLVGVPDVNGDNLGDILVGAPYEDPDESPNSSGRVYLFSGSEGSLIYEVTSPNEDANGLFGFSVANVVNVGGNDRGDFLVGAPGEDPSTGPDFVGRAYLFSGSTGGPPSDPPYEIVSANQETDGRFGDAVAGVPDVDGDGRGDLLVGARDEDPAASPTDAGRAYLYSGASSDLLRILSSPNPETEGRFGRAVAGLPDVDGDGRGDLLVGASGEDPGASPENAGRAYLFSGASGALLRTLASPNEEFNGRFGISVAGVPDADGDGRGDLLVGANLEDPGASPENAGRAYLFSGASGALLRVLTSANEETGGNFGRQVAGVPDANGDGRGDLLVGAQNEDPGASPTDAGRAYLFSGATGALLRTLSSPSPEAIGRFGFSVSGVADANGDGRGDLLVGADLEDPGASPADAGRSYLYSGATGALLQTLSSPSEEPLGRFGAAVSGVPDADGDSRGDLLVGAPLEDSGASPADAGRSYLFSGATGVLLRTLTSLNEEAEGRFGLAVAGVSDATGDGRGDVLIGAPFEDPGVSPTDAGRAYLFSGIEVPAPLFNLTATATTSLTVSPGGSVSFAYTVENNSPNPVSGDLYFTAERNGAVGAEGIITTGGPLAPGGSVSSSFTQQVPGNAPVGSYTYTISIGTFPTSAVDSETFTLVVTGSSATGRIALAEGLGAWTVIDVSPWSPIGASARAEATTAEPLTAYPNPATGRVRIAFGLEEGGEVRLAVYDALGREVAVLADGLAEAGQHAVMLDGAGLASGVYLVRLEAGARVETRRLTLVR